MGVFHSTNLNSTESEDEVQDEDFIACGNWRDRMESKFYTTDAVETNSAPVVFQIPQVDKQFFSDHVITVDKVAEIERSLEFYEKVSLVYLLYDDSEIAYQHLLQLLQGAQLPVLLEWARFSIKSENWQGKFLEALCIIQNYQVISQLGYNETEVNERYLPLNENTSLFIDRTKKQLYRICENFTNDQVKQLLDIVKRDFEEKKIAFKQYEWQYLEIYLLYWTTEKYISNNDLTNLCKAFKIMEMFEIAENLARSPSSRQQPRIGNDNLTDNCEAEEASSSLHLGDRSNDSEYLEATALQRSLSSMSSTGGSSIQQDRIRKNSYDNKSYAVDNDNPGVCLIINQEEFYTEFEEELVEEYKDVIPPRKLDKREGTNVDRDKLKATFSRFGFKVIIANNLIHSEIKDKIKEAVNMVTIHSSLIICILSHGTEGKVYGVNSIPVEVRDIQNTMCRINVLNLKGKPKVLILQSCQGTECQEVVENDEGEDDLQTDGPGAAVPRTADVLVFWATVPGYGAVRDKKRGTWFIQALCETILQQANEMHFEDICTLVKQQVIDKRWNTKSGTRAMVPIKESTLRRFFFLPPIKNETVGN